MALQPMESDYITLDVIKAKDSSTIAANDIYATENKVVNQVRNTYTKRSKSQVKVTTSS